MRPTLKPIFVLALLLAQGRLLAQATEAPYLLKDINTVAQPNPSSASPSDFFVFGSRLLYVATVGYGERRLWSTDGTAAGTFQVTDPARGGNPDSPSGFAELNGKVIFNGVDDQHGQELWVTDGTAEGTKLLADIRPGASSSSPGDRFAWHGKLYFMANDGLDGVRLWVTDGTPAGTQLFPATVSGFAFGASTGFAILNDTLYITGNSGLWKSDGTAAGTVRVKAGGFYGLTVAGTRLFFSGYDGAGSAEPWVSDGTDTGTHVIDGIPQGHFSLGSVLIPFGDRVLFAADDGVHGLELWISDGTAGGTHLVRDIAPGAANGVYSPSVAVSGGTAYFAASNSDLGTELWKSDGTEAGTVLVRDIFEGKDSSAPVSLLAAGGGVYFSALTPTGRTLWFSDGTGNGTRRVRTSGTLTLADGNTPMISFNGSVYFSGANALNGYELWRTDGTDSGTFMVLNADADAAPSSDPQNLTPAGDWLYFNAWDGVDINALWRSDGTPEGTVKVTGITSSSISGQTSVGPSIPYGRSLFFPNGGKWWMTDGTPEGTGPAAILAGRFPEGFTLDGIIGDTIFARPSSYSAPDVYATSLSSSEPAIPLGIPGGTFFSFAGLALYFGNNVIYRTDGTPAGTWVAVAGRGGSSPVLFAGLVYFFSNNDLWKTDGTTDGTVLVKTLTNTAGALTVAGKNLFFLQGPQLWVSDGTGAGTHALPGAPLTLTASYPYPPTLIPLGDRVVFADNDPVAGNEPWVSDGTAEGTHLLLDIYPGSLTSPAYVFGSAPSDFTPAGGEVYFSAEDPVYGRELWVTDGTTAGTHIAADLAPGTAGSSPHYMAAAGSRLFFGAFTAATGRELWALPLAAGPRISIDDARVAEGNSGTAVAHFHVTLSAASPESVTVDYATADGTATAGSDYDAVSGTLTFAPGQTVKTIDVPVHGDTLSEGNEVFSVVLRNLTHAIMAKSSGFALIEDDDQSADLALALDFSQFNFSSVSVNAVNHGPSTGTNLQLVTTAVPYNQPAGTCQFGCQSAPLKLDSGATVKLLGTSPTASGQQYLTATLTGHESDPQPGNNSVAWTVNGALALDAISLAPGANATAWYVYFKSIAGGTSVTVTVASSDPSVLTVPATLTVPVDTRTASFPVHALAAGTATIRISDASGTIASLVVAVQTPGTRTRWAGGVSGYCNSQVGFDQRSPIQIFQSGRVPFTGELATGDVRITSNGQELGRITLKPDGRQLTLSLYSPVLGTQPVRLEYGGDANFLPVSLDLNLYTVKGYVTITTAADRAASNATLHINVTGSPSAAPAGTVTVSEPGVLAPAQATLIPGSGGIAHADVSLTGLTPGTHTLVINYSGDGNYNGNTTNARLLESHRRAAGH